MVNHTKGKRRMSLLVSVLGRVARRSARPCGLQNMGNGVLRPFDAYGGHLEDDILRFTIAAYDFGGAKCAFTCLVYRRRVRVAEYSKSLSIDNVTRLSKTVEVQIGLFAEYMMYISTTATASTSCS